LDNQLIHPRKLWFVAPLLAILIGVGMGVLAYVASHLELKWTAAIVLSVGAGVAFLYIRDTHKLILLMLITDISIGMDIAIRDQEWHVAGPTGYIVSLMTIGLVIGYGLWLIERRPRLKFYAPMTVPALLYFASVLLSLFQSRNIELSLFGVCLHTQFILYYLYLANQIERWDHLRLVMNAVAGFLLFESVYMVLQYFFGFSFTLGFLPSFTEVGSSGVSETRYGGTIGSPNSAAAYLAAMMGIVLGAYATRRLISPKLALPAFGLGFVALILTMTRTAWASLAIIVAIMLPWLWRSAIRKNLLPTLAVIVVMVGVIFGSEIITRLKATETDTTRQELAYMARNIIKAYPLGVGDNNYDQVMSDRFAHPNWVGHTLFPAHNKYLLVWAEGGYPGLVTFILLLLAAALQSLLLALRKGLDKDLAVFPASLVAVIAGYSFHMTTEAFSTRANVQILWLIMALAMAIQPLFMAPPPPVEETSSKSKKDLAAQWD